MGGTHSENNKEMLRSIPTIATNKMNAYFDTIDSKLTAYENLLNEAPMFLNILSYL